MTYQRGLPRLVYLSFQIFAFYWFFCLFIDGFSPGKFGFPDIEVHEGISKYKKKILKNFLTKI